MNEFVMNYHKTRRSFVIVPECGIILAEPGVPYSHRELLEQLGILEEQVANILDNCPRGFFLENNLALYQGRNVAEGDCWVLNEENYDVVRKYFADLMNIFPINESTKFYLGVRRGIPGANWPLVNEVDIGFFK